MPVDQQALMQALQAVQDPNTGRDFVSTKALKNLQVQDGDVSFEVELGYPAKSQMPALRKALVAAARSVAGVENVSVNLQTKVIAHAAQRGVALMPNVKNIIAVASGKGGVGKSTTAVNLALALAAEGATVGVLDADIYGPSLPKLLAIRERPQTVCGTRLKPISKHGLTVMSIGFLIEEETPMIWRGPMVMSALTQMLREVAWGELDVMIVDMPPGTGDAQLTMAQQVPLKGSVIVSTPQDLALIDARRGIAMFKRVNVPVLGIVENMSTFICPKCGERSDIFGHGGARQEAERLGVPFLGEIPLEMEIRETSDAGLPIVVTKPDGPQAKAYRAIAEKLRAQLADGGTGKAAPKIVIEA
jgi:ATP-binding protein involved in chromosome partitioning